MSLTDAVGFVVAAAAVYLGIGVVFAIPFVSLWAKRLDSHAGSGTLGFRCVVLPGAAALWPVLAVLLLTRRPGSSPDASRPLRPEALKGLQAVAFGIVILSVPVVVLLALSVRSDFAPSRLPSLPPAIPRGVEWKPLTDGITARAAIFRTSGERRIAIEFPEPLAHPSTVLYWSPAPSEGLTQNSVFLGAVWGPSRFLFDLPSDAGSLLLVDFTDGGTVLWSVFVPEED